MNRTVVVMLSLLAAGLCRQVLAQKAASFNGFDFVDKSGFRSLRAALRRSPVDLDGS